MKFYCIDMHYDSFIEAIIDENNQMTTRKVSLHLKEFGEFLKELSRDDYIAVEARANSFWFYDQVKDLVKGCFIINPSKFLQIYKSNKKTVHYQEKRGNTISTREASFRLK